MTRKSAWKAHGKRIGEYCYFPKTLFLFLFLLMFSGFLFAGWGAVTIITEDDDEAHIVGDALRSRDFPNCSISSCLVNDYPYLIANTDNEEINIYQIVTHDKYDFDDPSYTQMKEAVMTPEGSTKIHFAYITFDESWNLIVRYNTFNVSSETFGTAETAKTLDTMGWTAHSIVLDADNNPIIFYIDEGHIYYIRKTSGTWSSPAQVDSSSCGGIGFSVTSSGNDLYVLWWRNRNFGEGIDSLQLTYRKGTASGGFSSNPEESISRISGNCMFKSQWLCSIKKYGDYIHSVWFEYDDGTSYLRYRKRGASLWDSKQTVFSNSDDDYYFHPFITLDEDGYRHIVWSKYNDDDLINHCYYVYYEGMYAATQISSNSVPDSLAATAPTVQVDSEGNRYVIWKQFNGLSDVERNYFPKLKRKIDNKIEYPGNVWNKDCLYYKKFTNSVSRYENKIDTEIKVNQISNEIKVMVNKRIPEGTISIYDITGRLKARKKIENDSIASFNTKLSNGVYYVVLSTRDSKPIICKFLKLK